MTALILVIGNLNVDLVMGPQAPWPQPGTEVLLPQSDLRVGGAAGNAALALEALAAPYRLIANRGDDSLGRWLAEAFPTEGTSLPVSSLPTTVSVGITHPGGERTFFTSAGHLNAFDLGCIEAQWPNRAEPGSAALIVGSFVTPALLPDMMRLLQALRARDFAVALDTGWPDGGWTSAVRDDVTAWLPLCDHLLINEIETRGLGASEETVAAARAVLPLLAPGGTLVVKRGPCGALALCGSEHVSVAAPEVAVIDTIGAGDAFNAAYLVARLRGADLGPAVTAGVQLASRAISTKPRQYV